MELCICMKIIVVNGCLLKINDIGIMSCRAKIKAWFLGIRLTV